MLCFKHLLIRDILQFAQQELVMVDLEISTSWPQNALRRWFSTWYFKGCLLILLWVGESSNFSIMEEVQDVSTVCSPQKRGRPEHQRFGGSLWSVNGFGISKWEGSSFKGSLLFCWLRSYYDPNFRLWNRHFLLVRLQLTGWISRFYWSKQLGCPRTFRLSFSPTWWREPKRPAFIVFPSP